MLTIAGLSTRTERSEIGIRNELRSGGARSKTASTNGAYPVDVGHIHHDVLRLE